MSIYIGALVVVNFPPVDERRPWSVDEKVFDAWDAVRPGGPKVVNYNERHVRVKRNEVGIVVDKCANDLIRSPDRTWLVLFGPKMAVARQVDLKRVSLSWKESRKN